MPSLRLHKLCSRNILKLPVNRVEMWIIFVHFMHFLIHYWLQLHRRISAFHFRFGCTVSVFSIKLKSSAVTQPRAMHCGAFGEMESAVVCSRRRGGGGSSTMTTELVEGGWWDKTKSIRLCCIKHISVRLYYVGCRAQITAGCSSTWTFAHATEFRTRSLERQSFRIRRKTPKFLQFIHRRNSEQKKSIFFFRFHFGASCICNLHFMRHKRTICSTLSHSPTRHTEHLLAMQNAIWLLCETTIYPNSPAAATASTGYGNASLARDNVIEIILLCGTSQAENCRDASTAHSRKTICYWRQTRQTRQPVHRNGRNL